VTGYIGRDKTSAGFAEQKRGRDQTVMIKPSDDDERTTSLGLFNTAEAFWLSAIALEDAKVDSGHAASPIRFCYYHAVELYLKALLRQELSVKKITQNFGHNINGLMRKAEALGLVVTDEDREVFSKADTKAILQARYIETGAKNWPTLEELRHTCKRVRDGVGDLLLKANVLVRL
jgi:HEPN domain-containing protein